MVSWHICAVPFNTVPPNASYLKPFNPRQCPVVVQRLALDVGRSCSSTARERLRTDKENGFPLQKGEKIVRSPRSRGSQGEGNCPPPGEADRGRRFSVATLSIYLLPADAGWPAAGVATSRSFPRNAAITSSARRCNCSTYSACGIPSGQWNQMCSRPGYLASISFRLSITKSAFPHSQTFCSTPSSNRGRRAGAPGVPQGRPC